MAQGLKDAMSIARILTTSRGAEQAGDGNNFIYYFNRNTEKVKYWICAQRDCSVRLSTRVSTNRLVGEEWPEHDHSINLLKRRVKEVEAAVIKKYAGEVPSASSKQVLSDISNTLLASEHSDTIFGMSSGTAIKARLYREKKKANAIASIPRNNEEVMSAKPRIPRNNEDVMSATIPKKLTTCAIP